MENLVKNAKKAGMTITAEGEGFKVTCNLKQVEAFGRSCIADYVEEHNLKAMKSSLPEHDKNHPFSCAGAIGRRECRKS